MNLPELPWLDVRHTADLIAAAAGQAWIERRGDAVGVEVRRSGEDVVRDPVLAVGVAIIAAGIPIVAARQRQPLSQLVLDLGREVPVAVSSSPPLTNRGRPADGIRVGLPEELVVERTALAVRGKVAKVAIWHEVVVVVVPGT